MNMYHFNNPNIVNPQPMYHNVYHQPQFAVVSPSKAVIENTTISNLNIQQNIADIQLEQQSVIIPELHGMTEGDKPNRNKAKKGIVDTSTFTIEERLVTAVWVHERKKLHLSMGQIKRDFKQRFGREAPAKNTLLVWEKKLFTTGSVHDAPRPGRPANRASHVSAVRASLRAAPTLSLRARAAALRLPRTTLRTILHTDLTLQTTNRTETKSKRSSTLPVAPPPGDQAPLAAPSQGLAPPPARSLAPQQHPLLVNFILHEDID